MKETIRDCLTEAMDIDGLSPCCSGLRQEIPLRCDRYPMPSAFCHEILNANPYAYLDDAPLEERRARAVEMRRVLPPEMAGKIGALDPDAIDEVAAEAWPVVRDADELHDALLTLIWIPDAVIDANAGWREYLAVLSEAGRAAKFAGPEMSGWAATERIPFIRVAFPEVEGGSASSFAFEERQPNRDDAILAIVRGWMESTGPVTAAELSANLRVSETEVQGALFRLEAEGQVLRGSFREPVAAEWCDRRLLARIHRLTIGRLRKEVQPVSAADFMKFLFQWQHVLPQTQPT